MKATSTGQDPAASFAASQLARKLLRGCSQGALATLMAGSGAPYCSLVNVASAATGAPILLMSRLAIHTKNILADSRVSLMLDERRLGDPLEGTRIMLSGHIVPTADRLTRARYLSRHPSAAQFIDFADFSLFTIAPSSLHLVAGFGRITDLAPAEFLTDVTGAQSLLEAEQDAVEHMNKDHAEALFLYATRLLGAPAADWRCLACDPDGMDMTDGSMVLRLDFPQRVTDPAGLRQVLKELAQIARKPVP